MLLALLFGFLISNLFGELASLLDVSKHLSVLTFVVIVESLEPISQAINKGRTEI